MTTLTPGAPAPELNVDLVGGGSFKLADAQPDNFTMVVFYRGLHCPVCKQYNRQLQDLLGDYADLGVDVVAVSMDDEERATKSVEDWGVDELATGYGMSEATARDWGLFISSAIKDEEPETFSEPGLALVKPDGTLFYLAINSMPFGRPDLEDFVGKLGWILDNDYPARGQES